MEDTGDGSMEPEDPHEQSSEKVATFVRTQISGTYSMFSVCRRSSATTYSEWQCFPRVDKTILEEWLKNDQLNDRRDREDVTTLISGDDKSLSTTQLIIWVDNFRSSLKRQKDGKVKQSEFNDKEQENMKLQTYRREHKYKII